MKISDEFKNSFEAHTKSYLPELIIQNGNFKSAVHQYFENLNELSAIEVCSARKKALGLNCEEKDLAERCLRLSDGTEFIAGPRFKNLDTNFPFIMIHKSKEVSSIILEEIKDILIKEFKEIKPKGYLFKDKPELSLPLEKWSHTVFGEVRIESQLNDRSNLIFNMSRSLDWHSQYVKEYHERLSEKPELRGYVRIGDLSEFEEAATNDTLLLISDRFGFAGVVAAIDSPLYGLESIYMIENYLSKRWVGKKLSPVVQRYFFKNVPEKYKYVWGTIFDKNLSSLNTALRVGRKIIETEYFFRFS